MSAASAAVLLFLSAMFKGLMALFVLMFVSLPGPVEDPRHMGWWIFTASAGCLFSLRAASFCGRDSKQAKVWGWLTLLSGPDIFAIWAMIVLYRDGRPRRKRRATA